MKLAYIPTANKDSKDELIKMSQRLFLYETRSSTFKVRRRKKTFVVKDQKTKGIKSEERQCGESPKSKNEKPYLNIEIIRKMLNRLLFEKRIDKEKLARILEITIEELKELLLQEVKHELITRVNLPLIGLYCRTDFEKKEQRAANSLSI